MSAPSNRLLGPLLFGLVLAGLVALVTLNMLATGLPNEITGWQLFFVVAACYGLVGALLAGRRPHNSIGWLLWMVGSAIGLALTCAAYADLSLAYFGGGLPLTLTAAWLSSVGPVPAIMLALLFLPLLFPTGSPPSLRWRPVAMLFGSMIAISTAYAMFRPGPLDGFASIPNPYGIEAPGGGTLHGLANVLPAFGLPLAVVAAIVRYRHGGGVARLQLRWFAFAVLLTMVMVLGATVLPPPLGDASWVLVWPALGLIPIAIGIAILRYRLYDIDRLISRTFGWALSTGAVLVVFAAGLAILEGLLAGFTQGATLAVAASTLVAFAVFQPVRRRIQRAVDRRFDRARYDGERTAARFAERLRDVVALETVAGELVSTAGDALRPAGASVWLRQA
jgi:hypothetical protein